MLQRAVALEVIGDASHAHRMMADARSAPHCDGSPKCTSRVNREKYCGFSLIWTITADRGPGGLLSRISAIGPQFRGFRQNYRNREKSQDWLAGGQSFELSVPFHGYAFKTGGTIRILTTLRKGPGRWSWESVVRFLRPRSPEWELRDSVRGEYVRKWAEKGSFGQLLSII